MRYAWSTRPLTGLAWYARAITIELKKSSPTGTIYFDGRRRVGIVQSGRHEFCGRNGDGEAPLLSWLDARTQVNWRMPIFQDDLQLE